MASDPGGNNDDGRTQTVSRDELTDLVARLKTEIAALEPSDQEARTRLQSLIADLETRLADATEDDDDEALMDSLRESVERFEVEHPRATGIINEIMVMLGNMGI